MCTTHFLQNNSTMERLEQGHLHPLIKWTSRESNPGIGGGRNNSSKELFEQPINSYSKHLHEPATVH